MMSNKIPSDVQSKIKKTVYIKADSHGYCHKGRQDNGVFMVNLVNDPEVGGILSQYMTKPKIKTYIKDAILNRYSKDNIANILSSNIQGIVRHVYSQGAVLIEERKSKKLFLLRLDSGDLVIVANGTFVKWETALRNALEFVARSPGLPPKQEKLHILLQIAVVRPSLTEADRKHMASALNFAGVRVFFNDGTVPV